MKKIFKNAFLSVIMAVCVFVAEVVAFAETKTDDLITLEETTNLAVVVGYETEEPTVSFLNPSGDEVKEGSEGVEVSHDTEGKKLYFQITNAERGDWKIVYDKKSNSQISVDFGKFSSGIWINSIEPKSLEGNTLTVTLDVSQTENVRYNYSIYAAVVDAEGVVTGTKLLETGSAVANEVLETDMDVSSLGASEYYVYAKIDAEDNGTYIFDEAVSEKPFNYKNADTPPAVSDLYVELDVSNEKMYIDWEAYCDVYGEKIVAIFGNGETEPFYHHTTDSGTDRLVADVDMSKLPFRVEFTYKDGEIISETFEKNVDMGGVSLELSSGLLSNSYTAQFDYEVTSETVFEIENGDEEMYPLTVNGQGNFSVKFSDKNSNIRVSYLKADNVRVVREYSIVVDEIAPTVELFENKNTIRTYDEAFDITGSVEVGASLELDGKAVTLNEDGTFKANVKLNEGENVFEVVAVDAAGNKTVKNVEIIREKKTTASASVVEKSSGDGDGEGFFKKYLPFIITAGVSIVAAVVAIILSLKKKVSSNKKFLYNGIMIFVISAAVLSLVGVIALLIYRYNLYKKIGPDNFLKELDESINSAYELILRYNQTTTFLNILLVVFIVLAVLSLAMVLIKIIPQKLKNRKPKPKKEKPVKAQTQTPVAPAQPVVEEKTAEKAAEQPAEKPVEKASPKFCKKCGAELNGAKFCKKCGEKAQ